MDFDVLENGSLAEVLIGESVYVRSSYNFSPNIYYFTKVKSIKIFYVKYRSTKYLKFEWAG